METEFISDNLSVPRLRVLFDYHDLAFKLAKAWTLLDCEGICVISRLSRKGDLFELIINF